jgi:hypothetical protein
MRITVAPEAKLAKIAPTYDTPMYTPNKVGETSMALATTGAITGKVSKAMVTRAWINKVMNNGIQVRQGGLSI